MSRAASRRSLIGISPLPRPIPACAAECADDKDFEKKEIEIITANLTTLQEKFGKDYKEMIATMVSMEHQFLRLNQLLMMIKKNL